MKQLIRSAIRACGFDIVRYQLQPKLRQSLLDEPEPIQTIAEPKPISFPPCSTERDQVIMRQVADYTMTSFERQIALIRSVRYLVKHQIEGSIVECGVWRGGSTMASALTLMQEGDTNRDIYLFDTFEGMTPPKDVDKSIDGISAQTQLEQDPDRTSTVWAVAGIDDVSQNMRSTGYPLDRVKYVKGPVEETIPAHNPMGSIALLRLDTDWYDSTKHELVHLFPLLCEGGILIIDDYGHWEGAKKAVDEYFAMLGHPYYLHHIDYTGRLLVKSWSG